MYDRDLKGRRTGASGCSGARPPSARRRQAERLEGLRAALAPRPLTVAEIDRVLRRVDGVLNWRYVDALGELRVDPEALVDAMDVEAMSTVRLCLAEASGHRAASE